MALVRLRGTGALGEEVGVGRREQVLVLRDLVQEMKPEDVATALYGLEEHARWCKSHNRWQDGGDCNCKLRQRREENVAGDVLREPFTGRGDDSTVWHLRRASGEAWCGNYGPNEGITSILEHATCPGCLEALRPGYRVNVSGVAEPERLAQDVHRALQG